jgi:uncharacterized lipoprotein YehR (DUF1307 family)
MYMRRYEMKRSLTAIIIVLIMIFSLTGCNKEKADPDVEFYYSWMDNIKDDTLIKDIVIPGSHDAGTMGMIYAAETQSATIQKQLKDGVRYFDIRVEKRSNMELVIYHSVAKGQSFKTVCDDILKFMGTNSTELVILDFQHFKGDSMEDVAAVIEKDFIGYVITNDTDMTDMEFIDQLTLKDCRGKILVTWGSDTCMDRSWAFRRNNDNSTLTDTVLESYYTGSLHKSDSEDFITEAMPRYFASYVIKDEGLFVLQCQLTAKFILGSPRAREKSHDANMTRYIQSLKDNEADLPYVNIIMRDFITEGFTKIDTILELNYYKGNVKEDALFLGSMESRK